MKKILLIWIVLFYLNKGESNENTNHVLSRRKRYLTFPDGSSLQLVFCLQQSAVIPIGDIFLVGNTAALAWELPTDPKFFQMFNKYKKYNDTHRGDHPNDLYEEDENIVAKNSHKKKQFFTPIFVKRSIKDKQATWKHLNIKINRQEMHEKQMGRNYLKIVHTDKSVLQFHRASRSSLYRKLEFLFKAFGWDGKQCVLRRLCENSRYAPQGSFLQELTRIIFTFPKGATTETDEDTSSMKEYDIAHSSQNCHLLYPNCPFIVSHKPSDIKFTFDNYFK